MKNNSSKETQKLSELNWNNPDSENRAICIQNALFLKDKEDWETAIYWVDSAINNYSEDKEENAMCDIAQLYAIKGYCLLFENKQEESKECYLKSTELHFKAYSKNVHKAKEFYKFFSIEESQIDSILGSILLKHPSMFNDPMDSPILQDTDNGVPFIEVFNGVRIGCFGEVKQDDEFYLKPKKWSFYGGMHSGICICYDFSEIEIKNEYHLFRRIKYENQFSPTKGVIGGLLSKSMVYNDEDEWRIITYDRNEKNIGSNEMIPIKYSMIRRIYFGFKCDKMIQEKIYNKLKGENIEFFQVHPSEENYYELTCSPFSID
ncbi:DUF2971 domain-containing protein [Bacteroides cellulosilyticus]|uniref:DUF2971 domain-containing protein n=1 Tax=Bacteroides cellulosilyticus TaxID=246787 RepID=A0AAW8VI59_9BACE|nr:DUF2971 domain-containing protein [Bacteroides cellulosilyticus]MDT4511856.1 DUF2971 domain-containing protein [Bacteroides cellulosilyticus]